MTLDEIAVKLGYDDTKHLEDNIENYGEPLGKWWEVMQEVASNTEIIGNVSDNEIIDLLEELDCDAVLYDSHSYGLPIHGTTQKNMIATVRTWIEKSGR